MIYRFRVTYEDHEDVYRDIEIKASQNFSDLHSSIQQAIAFDNSKTAVFYISDDYWRKGEEISLNSASGEKLKKGKNKQEEVSKKRVIADYVDNPHQKFVYVFDPEKKWTFNIELIKILPDETNVQYPRCVKSIGTSPKQYKEVTLPPPIEEDEPKIEKEELLPLLADDKISEDDDTEALSPIESDLEIGEHDEEGEGEPEGEDPVPPDADEDI